MASEIRVNKINSRTGVGTITLSPTGVDFTGIATVATLKATTGIVTTLSVTGTTTLNGNLDLQDNDKILAGTGDDLEFYHDGTHSHIVSNTGNLRILADGSGSLVLTSKAGEEAITCAQDGAVTIKHDNSTKFATTSTGVTITGTATADGLSLGDSEYAYFGASNDLQIYHNGSDSFIADSSRHLLVRAGGSGDLYLQSDSKVLLTDIGGNETFIECNDNGNVELYYDNSKKFETGSGGAVLQGKLQSQGSGASAQLEIKRTDSNVTGAVGALNFTASDGHSVANIHALGDGDNEGAHLIFKTTTAAAENNPYGSGTIERMRILATGGLTFNGDNAQANALDDYEEGTFTATCANSVTLHSDTDLLQYVKIGSLVTVMGQIRVNNSNSASDLTINNLPFTVYSSGEGSAYAAGTVRLYNADISSVDKYVICTADGGSTNLNFQSVRDNAPSVSLSATNDGYYMFGITYRTST